MPYERPPRFAGRLYPAEERAWREAAAQLLGTRQGTETAPCVLLPHAALHVSGPVAAAVLRRVQVPRRLVLLGPNHSRRGATAAIVTHGVFRIPGASVPIDAGFAEDLRRLALLTDDATAHAADHAIEALLPLLLACNGKLRIVPVLFYEDAAVAAYPRCVRIGTALADVVAAHGRDTLVVISSDLSHGPAAQVAAWDQRLVACMRALDAAGALRLGLQYDVCGALAIAVGLVAAQALGAKQGELLAYRHSGQAAPSESASSEGSGEGEGDEGQGEAASTSARVVGYAGMIFR